MNRTVVAVLAAVSICASTALGAISPAEAKKRLAAKDHQPTLDGFVRFLELAGYLDEESVWDIGEAYLALGVADMKKPMHFIDVAGEKQSVLPLHRLLQTSCGQKSATIAANILLQAGADINAKDPMRDDAPPIVIAAGCPTMMQELVKWNPNFKLENKYGDDALERAFTMTVGEEVDRVVFLLVENGFPLTAHHKDFIRKHLDSHPGLRSLVEEKKTAGATKAGTTKAKGAAVDWKALPPYTSRSAAEAKALLSAGGVASTVDEHFTNAINHREPQRLALALTAGADVRKLRTGSNYAPMIAFVDRCSRDEDDAERVSIAEQLVAAGADLAATDSGGANALIIAANHCPAGVMTALLKGGIPANAKTAKGATALKNAIDRNRPDIVALLLDAGVDPKKEPYNVKALASGKKEIEALLKQKRR